VNRFNEIGYCVVKPTAEQFIFNDTLVIVEPGGIVERSKRIAPRRSVLPPFTPTLPAKKYVASPALNAPLGSSINVLSADDVSTN
jgi:hypothetical protein